MHTINRHCRAVQDQDFSFRLNVLNQMSESTPYVHYPSLSCMSSSPLLSKIKKASVYRSDGQPILTYFRLSSCSDTVCSYDPLVVKASKLSKSRFPRRSKYYYASISVGSARTQTTKTVKSADPEWNESFIL